jgi:hypothetical protein
MSRKLSLCWRYWLSILHFWPHKSTSLQKFGTKFERDSSIDYYFRAMSLLLQVICIRDSLRGTSFSFLSIRLYQAASHHAPVAPAMPPKANSFSTQASTPASIRRKLQNAPGGFYAATPKLIRHVEYFIGGQDGNILVSKGGGLRPTEFIIRGVFEISRNDFNFTPDANFNPSNVFHGRFADIKLSCQLTAGRDDAFQFSSEDFPDVLDNLIHFEGLIPGTREYEKLSVIHNSLGQRSIKLTHSLFEVSVYHILIHALYCDKTGRSRKSARYY